MLSWFSGPRNPAQDSQEPVEDTQIEVPETPAPVFAARAIKHAIWGTPAPPETVKPAKFQTRADAAVTSRYATQKADPKDDAADSDGARRAGILSTPGTLKGRKTVSFGAQVVDNEGKKTTRSGIPNDCPGKFPSPWTPKVEALAEELEERPSSSSKLTQKLYEARDSSKRSEPKAEAPGAKAKTEAARPKPRARDDADITVDVMEPRSESGRYWRDQYLEYAYNSEREVRKIIKKQQIAKEYARKKDNEAIELTEKLEAERKRHVQREKELEAKNKDYKERLRQAMAENLKSSTEIAMLKHRLAVLEGTDVPEFPEDHSLPKTELELEFDQMMLDPQQASHYTLDATPVNGRSRPEKSKPKPDPSPPEQRPKAKDALSLPPTEPKNRLGVSPRPPRRSTTGNKAERPEISRSHAKSASTSAVEDPWVIDGDSAVDTRPGTNVSPVKRPVTRTAPSVEARNASSNRTKNDRHLQSLANTPGSVPATKTSGNLTPEEMRKKLARERIMQKKREREMGKENAKTNVVSMR